MFPERSAPQRHRLVFENAHLQVLDTQFTPGERTLAHAPLLTPPRTPLAAPHHVVSWTDFVRRDATGTVLDDDRGPPARACDDLSFCPVHLGSGVSSWHVAPRRGEMR